ncbi:MAG: thioredoxin-disulfide reductase [Verrucomicrobiota bacterium]
MAEHVLILGTGCAGLTAAIYAARAGLAPLVLEGGQPGGQLTTTSEVENFPGFTHGVDGNELITSMKGQAERFGARFAWDRITSVDFSGPVKRLVGGEATYEAQAVIIATGASPRLLGIPGEKEYYGGNGVTTCATCDGAFYRDVPVAVVGGGDSACEEALFLTRFASKVLLVHRRDTFRASDIMVQRVKAHPKIELVLNVSPVSILGDAKVHTLRVADKSGATRDLAVKCVFVAIGHVPNSGPFTPALEVDEGGYFVAGPNTVSTRVPGVFVAGDCSDHVYRQAITAAGMGCRAAIEAERWLAGH